MARFGLLGVFASACLASNIAFKPEQSTDFNTPGLPFLYNLTEAQFVQPPTSSYWTSSFITASDTRQYVVISHALLSCGAPESVIRYSILDVTNPENYWVNLEYVPTPNATKGLDGRLDLDFTTFGFQRLSDDSVSSMRTWGSTNNFAFNISWEATTTTLYNGGSGSFDWGSGNTSEWGLPACQTTGTITLNGTVLDINATDSFTWYDRQWGFGGPLGNWTWFEVHFPGSDIKASMWAIDSQEPFYQRLRFATVRSDDGIQIMPFTIEPDMTKTWTSLNSNITYPLKWTLDFHNGDYLTFESARADQEMYGPKQLTDTGYEGYFTGDGQFLGQKEAFGVVELVKVI